MRNRGNTVLITGGGSGIGLALARALIERGDTVLVCGRSAARLEHARRELPALETLVCDIRDAADRERLHAWVQERHPSLNVLINNAAVAESADFSAGHVDEDALEREVAANLIAPVRLIARFLPMLRQQSDAAIINVTAVLAHAPIAALPVHSATKAALRSFTRSLRRQLRDTAVRVIEVVPPVVDTAMQRALDVPKLDANQFAHRALARIDRGDVDIHVGQARIFRLGARLAPDMLFRLLNMTVERAAAARGATAGRVAHARV